MEELEEKTLRLENDCVPSGLKFLKFPDPFGSVKAFLKLLRLILKYYILYVLYIFKINKF